MSKRKYGNRTKLRIVTLTIIKIITRKYVRFWFFKQKVKELTLIQLITVKINQWYC